MEIMILAGALLVVLGIMGSILPSMPGPTLSFAGILLLFFARGAETVPVFSLVLIGVATLALVALDYIAPIIGAKYFQASRLGLIGAVVGLLIGAAVFFPWGILIGPFAGALVGELSGGKRVAQAVRSGLGTILGSVAMIILQTAFSIAVAIYFLVKLF